MTTYHTSHIEVLSGCISQACDTRHTDISSYDVRDLLIRLRFNLHNVPLCCLAVASQGGQECDRSTVYGQQPLLPGPTAQMPAAIIGRTASATSPAVTTVPGRHDRARPSRLCPTAGNTCRCCDGEFSLFRDTMQIVLCGFSVSTSQPAWVNSTPANFDTRRRSQGVTTPGRTAGA